MTFRASLALVALHLAACGARTDVSPLVEGTGGSGAAGGGGATAESTTGASPSTASSSSTTTSASSGSTCTDGSVVVPGGRAGRLEAALGNLYFTDDLGRVLVASPTGGTPSVVLDALDSPGDLAVHDDTLYITDRTRIFAFGLRGAGEPQLVFQGSVSADFVEVDASGIYWMSIGSGVTAGKLWRLAPGDAAPTAVAESLDQPGGFALVNDAIVFTAVLVPQVTLDLGVVARVPRAGGPITVLATQRQSPGAAFVLGDRSGWIEEFSPIREPIGVFTMPIDGSAPPSLLVQPPAGELPVTARADGDVVVFTTYASESGAIHTASLADPTLRTIDRRSEFFIEPAFLADRIAWTVQPLLGEPEEVDVRWVCR